AVEVYRWSDGSWLECQDMIDLSGIFREVYLCAAPQVHVRDIRVRTVLDEQYRDATLNMQIAVANAGQNSGTRRTVDAMLYDAAVQAVWSRPERIPIETGQQREVSAERDVPVAASHKWSAEAPNLYTLVLSLSDESGTVHEAQRVRVGFRSIEIKDSQFL